MTDDSDFPPDRPSKTKRKKYMLALQEAGQKLLALPEAKLLRLPLSTDLRKALDDYRKLPNSHEAKRRQLQYIGRLMRDFDLNEIELLIQEVQQPQQHKDNAALKLDNLVNNIVAEGDREIQLLVGHYSHLDRQYLRTKYLAFKRAEKAGSDSEMAVIRTEISNYLANNLILKESF